MVVQYSTARVHTAAQPYTENKIRYPVRIWGALTNSWCFECENRMWESQNYYYIHIHFTE